MLYTHYLISTNNEAPYRELATNLSDENLLAFSNEHYSHFCENKEFSKAQFAIYNTPKDMTVGCINQLYLREKDTYFYLSHVYAADMSQREKILPLLPNIIATAEFETIPQQNPDLSATQIPCRADDVITLTYPDEILKQLVQASLQILLNGGHLFIISSWEDCFDLKARDLMSQIISLLPYQCRRRLNFRSYANDISDTEQGGSIIFCQPQDALHFQKLYADNSIFYFLQQKISFPKIEILPYADFAVKHHDQIPEMLIYADRKLSGKLKNDPEFYDVLCHLRYVEKDESLDNYAKHRKWLIPNLSQLYQLGIASRKRALQLLENELKFEPDDADVPFETKLSAFLYCYETEMVSKDLMHQFLLHIRSCTDPIKWQLLCRQLDIPIAEAELPQKPPAKETSSETQPEESGDKHSAYIETADENIETVEIFAQTEPFDDDNVIQDVSECETEKSDEMPFLSVNIPSSHAEEELPSEEEKESLLPKEQMEPFLENLMQSPDIIKYINAGCRHYGKPLYQEFEVQRAVARYLSSAVSSCTTQEELDKVIEVADEIAAYQNEPMIVIAKEVHRLISVQEQSLKEHAEQQKILEQELKEAKLLSQFDAIFQSGDITKLNQIELIPICISEHISRAVIAEYALKQYREHNNALALLFVCCQYDVQGNLETCEPQKMEQYLHANIRVQELRYEWLDEIAGFAGLKESEIIEKAIIDYAASEPDLLDSAKLNHGALYFLLVENGILKSSTRKYIIFGVAVTVAIAAVTIAGILLSGSEFLN